MLQSVELPRRQDRLPKHAWAKRALMLFASEPQNWACQALRLRGGDLRARFAASSTRVLVLGAQEHPQGSLYLAYTPPQPGRVPPPSRGRSPLLPVRKSYQQCKKRPPKSPLARRVPPPSRGRSPLLPVCKSYQQCTNLYGLG